MSRAFRVRWVTSEARAAVPQHVTCHVSWQRTAVMRSPDVFSPVLVPQLLILPAEAVPATC